MNTYYKDEHLLIRAMRESDAGIIYDTYLSYGWHPDRAVYERYFREHCEGKRITFAAEYNGALAGHVSLVFTPEEPYPFEGMPLISDLCVFFHLHNMGIATALLDCLESKAAEQYDAVCLAVGCHSGYGAAQRLYVKRGYIFDGSGVWYRGKQLDQYAPCVNDDDLILWMSKKLK